MIAVEVKIPDGESRIVIVENYESDLHARLAAYYYIYNLAREMPQPTIDELIEVTSIWKTHGPVNAMIYRNPYGRNEIPDTSL